MGQGPKNKITKKNKKPNKSKTKGTWGPTSDTNEPEAQWTLTREKHLWTKMGVYSIIYHNEY